VTRGVAAGRNHRPSQRANWVNRAHGGCRDDAYSWSLGSGFSRQMISTYNQ
jgi:hypothetical protein